MHAYLSGKDLEQCLTIDKSEANAAVWESMNRKVKSYLLNSLDTKHVKLVLGCKTAKEIWKRLEEVHTQRSVSAKIVLQTQFFDAKMQPGEKVSDYVTRVEYLNNQLHDLGEKIPDTTVVGKIVSGLTESYSNFMSSWTLVPANEQTLSNLLSRLMAEEAIKNKFDSAGGSALAVHGNIKPGNTGKKGKWRNSNKNKSSESSGSKHIEDLKKRTKCRKCGKKGHWKAECPENNQANKDSDDKDDLVKGIAVVAEANFSEQTDDWIVDSGATHHMTFDGSAYVRYQTLETPKIIRYGNNANGYGIGVGDIQVLATLNDGEKKLLVVKDVLHIPDIRRKLFSVSASTKRGNTAHFGTDGVTIRDKSGETILIAKQDGNLYRATIKEIIPEEANVILSEENLELWHERLAHISNKVIKSMVKSGSAEGIPSKLSKVPSLGQRATINCISCSLGKQHHKSYRLSTRKRAETVGEQVHVDLCGPIGTDTIIGSKYFVLFKDEHSNFRKVYFVKSKDQVFECVQRCVADIEADTKEKVMRLVSDRGSELVSKRTQEFLLGRGISHEVSAPFTPQQNGFIERDNRTVMEAARSMLYHRKLPEYLWGEAVNTAVYLLNRVPNKNTGSKSPYELYFKRKPRLSHVRIFGSLAISKQQAKKRSGYQKKLEARGKKTILVGYEHDYTYRVFDPENKSIIVTRDVEIDERMSIEGGQASSNLDNLVSFIQQLPEDPSNMNLSDFDSDSGLDQEDAGDKDDSTEIDADDPQYMNLDYGQEDAADEQEDEQEDESPPVPIRVESLSPSRNDELAVVVPTQPRASTSQQSSQEFRGGNAQQTVGDNRNLPIVPLQPPVEHLRHTCTPQGQRTNPNVIVHRSKKTSKKKSPIKRALHYALRPRTSQPTYVTQRRAPTKPAARLREQADFAEALLAYGDEPTSYEEAIQSENAKHWIRAMDDEFLSLQKNETWKLVKLPKDRKPITSKWVYKVKRHTDGTIERYKARLVVRGFSQRVGLDYQETFSPVVRLDSIRILLAIAAEEDLEIVHFDVRTAFLHGSLDEDIYMIQPQGYEEREEELVCKLQKSLYGLKQASRAWNTCFVQFLKEYNLVPLKKDSCILVKRSEDGITLVIAIYVDDGLACSNSMTLLKEVIRYLESRFEISVMDPTCFVGLQIYRDRANRSLTINQSYYIKRIIERFNMSNAKPVSTPAEMNVKMTSNGGPNGEDSKQVVVPYREAIGSLLYAVLGTRPDLAFIVSYLARFSNDPRQIHWNAVKRVFRYLINTKDLGITYRHGSSNLICFVDADFANDIETRKSTTGFMLMLGGAPVAWKSTKQAHVATSTTVAEYVAMSTACVDVIWARQLLFELSREQRKPTKIFVDNQGAVKLVLNQQVHSKTKHIDIQFMFVRDEFNKKSVDVVYIPGDDQIADVLTKPLPKERFNRLCQMSGMKHYSS